MNNNEIAEKNYLLSPKGLLIQPSARSRMMIYDYDRNAVPLPRRLFKLKERDRYVFGNSRVLVELELAELGYAGTLSASVFDFETGFSHSAVLTTPFSFGKIELPASPIRGDVNFRAGEEASLDFSISTNKRYIRARIEHFNEVRSLYVNITLEQPQSEALCSLDSFQNEPECFRMGYKSVCLPASGSVVYGADTYTFSSSDSFGCQDWERSVLPLSSECGWYFMEGTVDDTPLALSFASHSDLQKPDINAVIYGGVLYDPGDVRVISSRDSDDESIRLRSENSRVDVVFTPIASTRLCPKTMRIRLGSGSRVFGVWNGTVRLGNGKPLEVSDMPGFIEKTAYRW